MDFVFMLTRRDRTVPDCLTAVEAAIACGVRHIGFKDIGVDAGTLAALAQRIREAGAVSYMEVVSTGAEDVLRAARAARGFGVDRLLGGTQVEAVKAVLAGSGVAYYPFVGVPYGHPTALGGSASLIERQCRTVRARGCAGVDLLAYRATEAAPLDLVAAARRGLGPHGTLIAAGSVDAPERIRALAGAGVDAFTVGSAAFDGAFASGGDLSAQLRAIMAAAATPAARAAAAE